VDVVKHVRQAEMNTAEPLVPEPCSEVGIVADNWKNCKSPGVDETSSKLTESKKVKFSLCLTNSALRLEDVWGSGSIDPHNLDLGTS
jgi:hypothetical protein